MCSKELLTFVEKLIKTNLETAALSVRWIMSGCPTYN
jgi:hypothetical protein